MEQNWTKRYIAEMMDHWNHNNILSIFPAELLPKTAGTRRKKAITNAHDISLPLLHALASISRITKGRHQEVMSACLTERQLRSDGQNYLMVADALGQGPSSKKVENTIRLERRTIWPREKMRSVNHSAGRRTLSPV